jgi:hypothetical protein
MQNVYLQRNMKKNADRGYEKTKPKQTQFKPNQSQFPSRNAKNAKATHTKRSVACGNIV